MINRINFAPAHTPTFHGEKEIQAIYKEAKDLPRDTFHLENFELGLQNKAEKNQISIADIHGAANELEKEHWMKKNLIDFANVLKEIL